MGKTNRDKKKFQSPNTLDPQAFIKAAEDARRPAKVQTKRPQQSKRQAVRNGW
jgi:hypothetical protein